MSDTNTVVNANVDREERKVILAQINRVANRGAVALDKYTDHLAAQLKVMSTM